MLCDTLYGALCCRLFLVNTERDLEVQSSSQIVTYFKLQVLYKKHKFLPVLQEQYIPFGDAVRFALQH